MDDFKIIPSCSSSSPWEVSAYIEILCNAQIWSWCLPVSWCGTCLCLTMCTQHKISVFGQMFLGTGMVTLGIPVLSCGRHSLYAKLTCCSHHLPEHLARDRHLGAVPCRQPYPAHKSLRSRPLGRWRESSPGRLLDRLNLQAQMPLKFCKAL